MLTRLRGTCGADETCPTLHRHADGWIIVQGYRTEQTDTVRIPASLAPEWDVPHRRHGDDLLISGRLVTDPNTLAALDLPAGESAVIVDPADVPALELTPC